MTAHHQPTTMQAAGLAVTPAELQILLDRAARRDAAIVAPSLAALLALRNSPTFTLGPKRLEAAT